MFDWNGLGAAAVSSLLFATQFVPQKYAPGLRPLSYNIGMVSGIALVLSGGGALLFLLYPPTTGADAALLGCAGLSGVVWAVGNVFLIRAVVAAGIARAFTLVNLTAALTFVGGVTLFGDFAGDLPKGAASVLLILAGSAAITRTYSGENGRRKRSGMVGLIFAAVASLFFTLSNLLITPPLRGGTGVALTGVVEGLGIAGSGLLVALAMGKPFREWRAAPARNRYLSASSGFIWAGGNIAGMTAISILGVGVAVPVLQGLMTAVAAVMGIAVFREIPRVAKPMLMFAAGAGLVVLGIAVMGL